MRRLKDHTLRAPSAATRAIQSGLFQAGAVINS